MIGDNELAKQLNSLKSIKPGEAWKIRHREFLLKQMETAQAAPVAAAGDIAVLSGWLSMFTKKITEPVMAVVLILLFMAGSAVASQQASKNSKPGDSLYIAKILSERTQLALTFNDKEKARLGIEFAGNRAKELNQVLAENGGEKEEQAAKLVDNFKKEISAVKTRLAKITGKTGETAAREDGKEAAVGSTTATGEEETGVFSANLGKDDKGISLSEPADAPAETPAVEPAETAAPAMATTAPAAASTTAATTVAETAPVTAVSPEDILKEAAVSLSDENYDTTITKLQEAVEAMNLLDASQASTTESGASGAGAVGDEGTVLGAMATGTEEATTTD
jgi:hypothetical protein